MTESAFQTSVVRKLRQLGWFVFATGGRGQRGVPDLFAARKDRGPYWLELKTDRGSLSPHQRWFHRRLREAGCSVRTVSPQTWDPEEWK